MPSRGSVFAILAVLLCTAIVTPAMVTSTRAQSEASAFPNRPIRIVVGFTPGGGTDVMARLAGARLQEQLGVPVVIENRPGAGGRIGPEYVANAPPDGYTLLGGAPGALTIGPAVWTKMNYTLKDFAPVSMVSYYSFVMVVNTAMPVKDVGDLVAWLKANPDKANYPTSSPNFTMAIELFKLKTGAPATAIPYKSGNESLASVVSGETAFAIVEPPVLAQFVATGKLRAIAVTGAKRTEEFPDLPTFAQAGVPDVVAGSWMGLLAPKGTPVAILKKLEGALRVIAAQKDFQEKIKTMSVSAVGSTSEQFTADLDKELAMWTAVAKATNVKIEQ